VRKIFLLLFCALFAQCAFANVTVLLPVEESVESGDTLSLGNAQPGEIVEIAIERKSGSIEWNSARVEPGLLPDGWGYSAEEKDKSIILSVSIPADARTASQNLAVVAFNDTLEERFNAALNVMPSLVVPEIHAKKMEVSVNECVPFSLKALNNSIAGHKITIKSDLPEYWFSHRDIYLKPLETVELDLEVCGKSPGYREFSFFVDSALNEERFASFPQEISVLPTLHGKYTSIGSGFPFFSPTVLPFYLVDFFLASLSIEFDFS